ncbi:MAG: hypothetical protein R3E93_13740 [Thiothrix sp.]
MTISKLIPALMVSSILVACGGGSGASLGGLTNTNTGGSSTGTGSSTTDGSSTGTGAGTGGSTDTGVDGGGDTGTGGVSSNALLLARNVVDAEYSDALERLVTVSSAQDNALNIINPATGEQQAIPLSLVPTSLGLSPDGNKAVVGHDGGVTYINLQTASVVDFYDTIGFKVSDIVLDDAGVAYATPFSDAQGGNLQSIDLKTGQVQPSPTTIMLGGAYLKLAPSLKAVYTLDGNVSPVDLEKIDVSVSPPAGLYDSPYHGDYDMGGYSGNGMWLSEDDAYILTAGETLFRTAATQDQDMLYQRSLADNDGDYTTNLVHADHSREAGKFVVILDKGIIGTGSDYRIKTYTQPFLNLEDEQKVSELSPTSSTDAVTPQFVFFNSDGSKRYTVLKQGTASYLVTF